MAFENPKDLFTGTAAADLSAKQFRGVALTGGADRAIDLCNAGAHFWGVVQNKPGLGEDATVARKGISKGEAGAAIALPAYLTTDSTGRFVKTTTSGVRFVAEALLGATAAGDIISVDLDVQGIVP